MIPDNSSFIEVSKFSSDLLYLPPSLVRFIVTGSGDTRKGHS